MLLCTCLPCVASCTELSCLFIVLACALLRLTELQLNETFFSQRLQIGACWPCAQPMLEAHTHVLMAVLGQGYCSSSKYAWGRTHSLRLLSLLKLSFLPCTLAAVRKALVHEGPIEHQTCIETISSQTLV